ncbi:MAG: acetyl-CoA carboxylase biotin carboxyl carrier protein [Gammaproteobacteria bacterium]|nr:acetyl-CoA carboxylase biotin carboxyl carrier protein [Gammaproteobacteria bacterium]
MEIKKIKQLIDLLNDTDITEFELSEGDDSVKICKSTVNPVTVAPMTIAPTIPTAQPVAPAPSSLNASTEPETAPTLGRTIKSPMVGTFYSAPSPDAEPFVSVGQHIKVGDTVCIVEAMKMFNKIEADIEGTIKQVLVNDGDPVEFDQPLFEIE